MGGTQRLDGTHSRPLMLVLQTLQDHLHCTRHDHFNQFHASLCTRHVHFTVHAVLYYAGAQGGCGTPAARVTHNHPHR